MYTIKKKDEVQVSLHSFSTTCEILVSLIGSACVIRLWIQYMYVECLLSYAIKKKDEVEVSLRSFSTTFEIMVSLIRSVGVIRLWIQYMYVELCHQKEKWHWNKPWIILKYMWKFGFSYWICRCYQNLNSIRCMLIELCHQEERWGWGKPSFISTTCEILVSLIGYVGVIRLWIQ